MTIDMGLAWIWALREVSPIRLIAKQIKVLHPVVRVTMLLQHPNIKEAVDGYQRLL